MKVEHIIPCICTKHPPTAADNCSYGMPTLQVSGDGNYFIPKCPMCGRLGLSEYKSPYLALKHWNEMQEKMYRGEGREIVFYDDCDKYQDKYGAYFPEYIDKWSGRTESHSEKETFEGCMRLMRELMSYFEEYLDYINVFPDDDERFEVSFYPNDIVRALFLEGTCHSGGTSCNLKREELGISRRPIVFKDERS